jgi:retrograde regulation protein 2
LYHERSGISLFDALISNSSNELAFSSETITQVSQTLTRFKSIAESYGVPLEHISVFATEAMRKANNAASMLQAIKDTSGLGVHVLTPEIETLFGAMGARSGFHEVHGVFLDLGGGSVQMLVILESCITLSSPFRVRFSVNGCSTHKTRRAAVASLDYSNGVIADLGIL